MKKINFLLTILAVLISFSVFSQTSNLIVYSNNPAQRFRLVVNGNLISKIYEENVKVQNLEAQNYEIKIIFENRMLGFIDKNIYIRPNSEKIYAIVPFQNSMGRRRLPPVGQTSPLTLEMISELPLNSVDDQYSGTANDEFDAVAYTTGFSPEATTGGVRYENGNVIVGNDENGISIGTNGLEINFDIDNIIEKITNENSEPNNNTNDFPDNEVSNNTKEDNSETANNNCTPSLDEQEFKTILAQLQKETMESKRLLTAKYVANNNCLLTLQVQEMIGLFRFENNKVELAKFGYHHVSDKENYPLLIDSFKFLTSKQEIKEYINEH